MSTKISTKRDYLNGTRYSLAQGKDWYHFNGDTELLGRFLEVYDGETVLDIGCNQGALLYYAKEKADIIGIGVDVFSEVLESAKENAIYNRVNFQFVCSRIQEYKAELVDVIVCNPPYFSGDIKNNNLYLDAARREKYLPLRDLMEAVHRLLKGNGRFYIVQKAEKIAMEISLSTFDFFCSRSSERRGFKILFFRSFAKRIVDSLAFTKSLYGL